MESYSSGRRGVPAKDVGVPAREGSNPSLSAINSFNVPNAFCAFFV